jgi:hypothetical protein
MTEAIILRLALLAIEKGLPLVLTLLERDLDKKVEDMTVDEMVKALDEIHIGDTDDLIRKGQADPASDESVPW